MVNPMDLPPSGSDYHQLRAFIAVAQNLSFSRAAANLGVSGSALSQLIRGFEERVGVRLLNRTTRSVTLTEAGENLLLRVQPAVAELADAIGQVRRYQDRPSGTVRIHAFRSAARRFIDPILAEFVDRFPDVVLDIAIDDAVIDFVAQGFDAAIRIGEVIEQDMVAVRLGSEMRQIAVASPAYLTRFGRPGHPRDLLRHRCIRWRWPGQSQPYAWEFCENGHWFSVAVNGPLIVNDKAAGVRAALAGVGIDFVVEDRVAAPLRDGTLVPLLTEWSAPFPGHFLCYPRQRQMAPALRVFIDAVRTGTVQAV
jgi:DNA-binding transcriptional LysR family regulator